MEELENYALSVFLSKDDDTIREYADALKYITEVPTVNKLVNLKLREVEYIKTNINNQGALSRIFLYMEGLDEKQLMQMKVVTFFGLFKSIKKQLEHILTKESELLTPKQSNYKWEAVEGSKRLSVLGSLPMIDNLAGGDPLKYEAILELPYKTILHKLYLDTIKSDIQYDMDKIKINHND